LITFTRDFTRFALFKDGFIFCILADQSPSAHDQKNLMIMTGAEIMKVHGEETYEMIAEKNRWHADGEPDSSVINRKGAFTGNHRERLNSPIEVKYTENIVTETEFTVTSVVYVKDNELLPFPEKLKSSEKATLAKMVEADTVLGEFQVTSKLLCKASPWRSYTGG
jgi:hypothetical protein